MAIDLLRDRLKADTFRPFTVHVVDRRSYRVPHPDYVSIGPRGRNVAVWLEDGGVAWIDAEAIREVTVDE